MPTPEEIKKIAREYARYTCSDISDAQERATDENIEYDFALPIFEWLSKTHCIVPKEQIYMRHGVANALMEQDSEHKEFYRGQSSVLESIFGKSLFNEEEECAI